MKSIDGKLKIKYIREVILTYILPDLVSISILLSLLNEFIIIKFSNHFGMILLCTCKWNVHQDKMYKNKSNLSHCILFLLYFHLITIIFLQTFYQQWNSASSHIGHFLLLLIMIIFETEISIEIYSKYRKTEYDIRSLTYAIFKFSSIVLICHIQLFLTLYFFLCYMYSLVFTHNIIN